MAYITITECIDNTLKSYLKEDSTYSIIDWNDDIELQKHLQEGDFDIFYGGSYYNTAIKNIPEDIQLAIVKSFSNQIKHIADPCEEAQLEAIKDNSLKIQYIDNPTPKVIKTAINKSGSYVLNYLRNPALITKDIVKAAIRKDSGYIKHIKNPPKDLQLLAVKTNSASIMDIENPCEEAQIEAIKDNYVNLSWIKHPTEAVVQLAKELRDNILNGHK